MCNRVTEGKYDDRGWKGVDPLKRPTVTSSPLKTRFTQYWLFAFCEDWVITSTTVTGDQGTTDENNNKEINLPPTQ